MSTCQSRFRATHAGVAAFAMALATSSTAVGQTHEEQTKNPILGRWALNLEASSFRPGPPPKSQVRTYALDSDGVRVTLETVDAQGIERQVEYQANVDSLEYPVTGSTSVHTIELKPVTTRVAEAILRHASKTIGTARRTISRDGSSMTIDYKGQGADGRPVEIIAVYEKQN